MSQLVATSRLEVVAVVLAIAYLTFAIRESIWCWPCALVSTAIYIYLFYDVALLSESALNVFYLLMAIYGWWQWQQGTSAQPNRLPISRLAWQWHAGAIVLIALLVAVTGWQMGERFGADFAYLDAATSWTAVWATWLTARKVLENWYYWLVIDTVSIGLYAVKGLALTALLFCIYVVLIFFGIRTWQQSLASQAT
ncbi:MAG: nicotinamide riboside transporter PnuC [Pseudomonadota bacterium]